MLLALDTSSPQVSVALARDADVLDEAASEQTMKHGEQLAPMVAALLERTGTDRGELTAIAAGVGPGPFTGLRVGLVTARTLGHVLGIPVYGVCSLDVLAAEAVLTGDVAEDFVVATDARRREVYWARYGPRAERLTDPAVDRPLDVDWAGPVVGEGASLYPATFPLGLAPERPSAGWLARLVAEERATLLEPEPMYLRRPDAVAPGKPKSVS
ncbi:tRNA (adenosine(37)-N6)-threonylcarbamoyltransferase complex dimerization subunit type 1 TsaB [Nocardioides donggukensis]|uniref:tRNA (Adenosine(37)-N6)-threonylcarbamoyltransferase complex dimerization subunit type 1 TsaB n=1 Tax=Nocardioides donggukensis TaxID=2774019 RepID=A0A927Q0K5_9ACTN|nr:tRNA (adenosine(37)-N6)-threonylcarbamoyltransferase complex dimerization subunit type 1 TsaB [Nocardioides donggukensis]MBD8868544.1 tRNA (adenosine(37)-N6)-threonylcarbamoyltransferase complex dimerization subunit type 1 TsaB [Nocardioides donggukensis]